MFYQHIFSCIIIIIIIKRIFSYFTNFCSYCFVFIIIVLQRQHLICIFLYLFLFVSYVV